jgi:hypothetical protein
MQAATTPRTSHSETDGHGPSTPPLPSADADVRRVGRGRTLAATLRGLKALGVLVSTARGRLTAGRWGIGHRVPRDLDLRAGDLLVSFAWALAIWAGLFGVIVYAGMGVDALCSAGVRLFVGWRR